MKQPFSLLKKPFALLNKKPFARFITKKLCFLLIIIFLSFTLLFILPYFMPSDPVDMMMARMATQYDVSKLDLMRERYTAIFGLEEPLITQYGLFWNRVLTMDFGPSFSFYPRPVGFIISSALIWTLTLIVPALILGFIVGNHIGAKVAFSKGRLARLAYTLSLYVSQSPYYWFGLIFVYILAVRLGLFPMYGGYSMLLIPSFSLKFFLDVAYHWVLPFLSIFLLSIGLWCTSMRAMTIYEKQSDYIYYSRQSGFTENRLRKDAQRNAILPQVTAVPINFGMLVGQTLLVEYVFGWPGLGTYMYKAVQNIDYPLMQGIFVFTVLLVLIGNFLVDIIYGYIDPRIRTGYVGGG